MTNDTKFSHVMADLIHMNSVNEEFLGAWNEKLVVTEK